MRTSTVDFEKPRWSEPHSKRLNRRTAVGKLWEPSRARGALVLIALLVFSLEFFTAFASVDRIVTLILGPITVFVVLAQFRMSPKSVPRTLWVYAVFILWTLVALPMVVSVASFVRYWRRLVELFVLAACVGVAIRKTGRIDVILSGFLLAGLVVGGYGYATGQLQRSLDPEYLSRAEVVYANPNGMAYVCLSGLIAVLYFWDRFPRKTARLILGLAAVLLEFAIIASASRGAFAASLALFGLWAWFCRRSVILKSPVRIAGVLAVGVILYAVTQFALSSTFLGKRFERTKSVESLQELSQREERANLIREGWSIAARHPLTGVGLNQMIYHTGRRLGGHSDLAEIPATTGFPGLLIYVGFLVAVWRKARRAEKLAEAARNHQIWAVRFPALLLVFTLVVAPFKMTFYDMDSVLLIAAAVGYAQFLEDRANLLLRSVPFPQVRGGPIS
jgi:O-antigen ligase